MRNFGVIAYKFVIMEVCNSGNYGQKCSLPQNYRLLLLLIYSSLTNHAFERKQSSEIWLGLRM
jgi:hypothetical protein